MKSFVDYNFKVNIVQKLFVNFDTSIWSTEWTMICAGFMENGSVNHINLWFIIFYIKYRGKYRKWCYFSKCCPPCVGRRSDLVNYCNYKNTQPFKHQSTGTLYFFFGNCFKKCVSFLKPNSASTRLSLRVIIAVHVTLTTYSYNFGSFWYCTFILIRLFYKIFWWFNFVSNCRKYF